MKRSLIVVLSAFAAALVVIVAFVIFVGGVF
jgi:hypothetical protein